MNDPAKRRGFLFLKVCNYFRYLWYIVAVMRRSLFRGSLVVIALVLAGSGRAQWTKTSCPDFSSPNPAAGGAMFYKDGILWAGGSSLWMSTDVGTTWNKTNFPNATVYDIYFVTPQHGVVAAS